MHKSLNKNNTGIISYFQKFTTIFSIDSFLYMTIFKSLAVVLNESEQTLDKNVLQKISYDQFENCM